MKLFEPLEQLESREDQLRRQVNTLPDEQKKMFYKEQAKLIKDPDTYAALNYLFIGGFHHIYLERYKKFVIEFGLLLTAIFGFIFGFNAWGVIVLIALSAYELPQLFLSQKIVRQYNDQISRQIYEQIRTTQLSS